MCSSFTFRKNERLSRKKLVGELFLKGKSFMAFPLRVQYLFVDRVDNAAVQVLISVPKKRFKHAVDRNLLKRRVREAYRLNKHELAKLIPDNKTLLVAFLYSNNEKFSYNHIEKGVIKGLKKLEQLI